MLKVLKQNWKDHVKYIIADDETNSSCLIDVYYKEQDFGSRACIYSLYVDDAHRKKKIATSLISKAEELAQCHGCESAIIDFDAKESLDFVQDFYRKIGYVPQFITFKKDF